MSECEREAWMRARNRNEAEIRALARDTERARVEQEPCPSMWAHTRVRPYFKPGMFFINNTN